MKTFTEYNKYITEASTVDSLPKTVIVGQSSGQAARFNGFSNAIATIHQKQANKDQSLFPVNAFDIKEFGGMLKSGETLCRISTPMTSNTNDEHRHICVINIQKATIRFVDNDKYEQEARIVSTRPNKFKFLNIDPDKLHYFKISGKPTEDSQDPFRAYR